MMVRHLILLLCLFSLPILGFAQGNYNISGKITDASSGESMISATVYVVETGDGVASNTYGFYSLALPPGKYTLKFAYLGFKPLVKEVELDADLALNIELEPNTILLKAAVVDGDSYKEKVNSTQMSVDKLTSKEAKKLPALFGEVDIIKTLQLKPGVQSGGEGTAGLYIRGGGADQNLIVLDEAIVYNASHLFGFFSTFNADAIKNVELYKGGFPAQYGGRLSSVVDVSLNDGNQKKYTAQGGLGLISSRLTVEGPIQKDKSSFIISGRRTYADIITRQINKSNEGKEDAVLIPDYYFYDLNAKMNYSLGPKDKIYLSGYFGRDVFGFADDGFDFGFDWGNTTGTLRWNHILGNKLFSNTSLIFSDYRYKIANSFDIFNFELGSNIKDVNLKVDFLYNPNPNHNLKFGVQGIQHYYNLGRLEFSIRDENAAGIDINRDIKTQGTEFGIYFADDMKLSARTKLNAGLRISGFRVTNNFYAGLEPRLAFNYKLDNKSALKLSYARMRQYNNLISNSSASLPTDLWYPATENVKPQISDQIAGGYSRRILEDKLFFSVEAYYKWLQNQIDLKDNADIFINDNLEDEFVFGKGWSYGFEFFLEKSKGKTTGWIGYTLGWTWRQFDESNGNSAINNGEPFNPGQDRRHDVSLVVSHQISKRLSVSGTWVYGSGSPTTLPTGFFTFFDIENESVSFIPDVSERSNYRYAPYHRMDLGLIWKFFPKWGESDLSLSVYNAYDRRNPYFIYYDQGEAADGGVSLQFDAKQVSLFPILPSITYNFKF